MSLSNVVLLIRIREKFKVHISPKKAAMYKILSSTYVNTYCIENEY